MAVLSHHGQKLSGTEIHFLSRDEQEYPQLTRLCLDFDFRVLGVPSDHSQANTQYLISDKYHRDDYDRIRDRLFTHILGEQSPQDGIVQYGRKF